MSKVIINGGEPLGDCPKDWDEARSLEDKMNTFNDTATDPVWKFDCGFKLDFDGPLISVSSRFYPPKTHYGEGWDGTMNVCMMGRSVIQKEFKCDTLEQLNESVESYIKSLVDKIKGVFDDEQSKPSRPA